MFKFSDDGKTASIDRETYDRLAQRTDKQKSMDLVNEMLAIAGELNADITKGLSLDPGKPSFIFKRKREAKRKRETKRMREATINFLRVMPPGSWFDPSALDDVQNED
ncbi:hypothetical protein [Methylicorpusculum sp.]|uniref:hypothetical protein n=1 Tax=Methylicorpusculum sp. TaxID=2713644 RepID=UPI0027163DE4|nr:hypothetical protein [Methylicorpusculum sp.]MDO8843839.1 hypothetical protein [Methylicorpusculum sp.]